MGKTAGSFPRCGSLDNMRRGKTLSSTESPVPPRCCPCSATGEALLSRRMRQQVLSPPQELLLLSQRRWKRSCLSKTTCLFVANLT